MKKLHLRSVVKTILFFSVLVGISVNTAMQHAMQEKASNASVEKKATGFLPYEPQGTLLRSNKAAKEKQAAPDVKSEAPQANFSIVIPLLLGLLFWSIVMLGNGIVTWFILSVFARI